MGMFDTIKIDAATITLPYPADYTKSDNLYDTSYQTKDLGKCLCLYELKDGYLYLEEVEREYIEDKAGHLGGYFNDLSRSWRVATEITENIHFYAFIEDYNDKEDAMINYSILVSQGKIVGEIKLDGVDKHDSSFRKESNARILKDMQYDLDIQKKWYYFSVVALRSIRSVIRGILMFTATRFSIFAQKILTLACKF